MRLKYILIPEHLGFYQSYYNFIKIMSSENENYLSTKLSSYVQKVIKNVVVWDGGGCLGWEVQALLGRSRAVPCGAAGALAGVLGIFWFSASGGVGAGCSP